MLRPCRARRGRCFVAVRQRRGEGHLERAVEQWRFCDHGIRGDDLQGGRAPSSHARDHLGATPTSRLVSGLQTGKPFQFKVAARNAAGQGPASTLSGPITVGAPGRPSVRYVKAAAMRGVVQVRRPIGSLRPREWGPGAPDGCKMHLVERRRDPDRARKPAASTGNIDPWVMVKQLTIGKTYRCTVTASNSRGTGVPSKPSDAFTV